MFRVDRDAKPRVQVKICGITNPRDASAAIQAGADALGFNFWPKSKRYINVENARSWLEQLPPEIVKVAVLADPSSDEAFGISRLPFVDALQLHGNESPEFCRSLAENGVTFAKAVPVVGSDRMAALPSFSTAFLVFDSISAAGFGGTGTTFPWKIARQFSDAHPEIRMILAGGLTSKNVGEAIRAVRPFGVDVGSGVEASPGQKDPGLVRAFIESVRVSSGV